MSSDCDLSTTDADVQVDFAKVLQIHHTDLRTTLNVQELIPLMRTHELITAEECQDIKRKQMDAEKIDLLVHILPRKGKQAYPKFIKCLESETQHLGHPELVAKLKETAGKLKCQQSQSSQSLKVHAGISTNQVNKMHACMHIYVGGNYTRHPA